MPVISKITIETKTIPVIKKIETETIPAIRKIETEIIPTIRKIEARMIPEFLGGKRCLSLTR
jgi:hypothetical protein